MAIDENNQIFLSWKQDIECMDILKDIEIELKKKLNVLKETPSDRVNFLAISDLVAYVVSRQKSLANSKESRELITMCVNAAKTWAELSEVKDREDQRHVQQARLEFFFEFFFQISSFSDRFKFF